MVSKPQPHFHSHIQRDTAKFFLPGSKINNFTAVTHLMSYHSQGTATRTLFLFQTAAQQTFLSSPSAPPVPHYHTCSAALTQKFPKLLLPLVHTQP